MATPTDNVDATFLLVQEALVGEYSLERELGRGGMGIVYLAREVRLDRLVALKVLPPQFAANDELRQRFLRESQTAARLSHPNIVPIFRVGEAGGFVYFAMAYVEGETLTQRVRSRGPLAPHDGVRILREAAWALAYAHARNIVHRDVKPDNILLEHGSGRAMLTDFGIAHVSAAAAATETGLVLGTPQYMSPEQAAGEKVDGRSDLYSLGLVAHLMLAGKAPFDDPSVAALLAKQITQPAPALTSVAPAVPRKIGEAIDRCLSKLPDQRFATGEALAEALAAADEAPRDVPAPVRVWISKSQENRALSVFIGLYFSAAFIGLAFARNGWFVLAPMVIIASVVVLPVAIRTRRLLRAGYSLEDIRSALRLHWARRREELAYEHVESSRFMDKALWAAAGVGWATVAIAAAFRGAGMARLGVMTLGTFVGAIATLLGLIDLSKRRRVAKAGDYSLKFWNSKWGERMVRLAGTRLRGVVAAPAAPQLTELAIGRASEALYQALPKTVRRNLRELPATVRLLEADAHKLRDQIEQVERSVAELGNDRGSASSRTLAAAPGEGRSVLDNRERMIEQLSATRDAARTRLASTIAALENIRLGLLRVQLGAAPQESVTAALQAAQRVADDVDRVVAADAEVSKALSRRP